MVLDILVAFYTRAEGLHTVAIKLDDTTRRHDTSLLDFGTQLSVMTGILDKFKFKTAPPTRTQGGRDMEQTGEQTGLYSRQHVPL
jgi:hypothetical protein